MLYTPTSNNTIRKFLFDFGYKVVKYFCYFRNEKLVTNFENIRTGRNSMKEYNYKQLHT